MRVRQPERVQPQEVELRQAVLLERAAKQALQHHQVQHSTIQPRGVLGFPICAEKGFMSMRYKGGWA